MKIWSVTALAVALVVVPATAQEIIEIPAADRTINANFSEVFRVGALDGALWETFGDIRGTGFDAEGNLYIFDAQSSRVVVVDAEGNFLREFGQAGEGPGEFRMALGFAVMRDGDIVIADMGHRAYQLFSAEGEFQRMVSMGGDDGMIRLSGLQPDPRGGAIYSGGGGIQVAMSRRGGPGGGPPPPTSRPIERITLDGETASVETVVDAWLPPRGDGRPETLEGGGMRFSIGQMGPRTFEPPLLVGALAGGGVVYSDSSAYALKIQPAGGGGVERVLRRSFTPEPVTESVKDAEKERQLEEIEEGEGPQMRIMTAGPGGGAAQSVSQDAIREMMVNRLEGLQFYPEVPVLRGLSTSWDGRIWVQRRGDEPTSDGPIDVLTAEGEYVGTFATGATEMPSSFGPHGLAAFLERDELDVPRVVVRRLPERIR